MAESLAANITIKALDRFSAPIRVMGGELSALNKKLRNAGKGFQLAANLNQAGEAAGRFSHSIIGALKKPADEFKEFETSMSRVSALSGEVATPAFAALRKQALELGATTDFTASQAAGAMGEFAMAGRDAAGILKIVPTTLDLAKASGEGMAETATILGSTMAGMGLEADKSVDTANVLTATFTNSATSLASLGESFKFVGPIAKSANVPLRTMSAAIGVLGTNGIRGSEAGTALRGVIARMVGPMRLAKKELKAIGLNGKSLTDLQDKLTSGDMVGVFQDLNTHMEGLTDAQRLEKLKRLFGQEGLSAASVLLDASVGGGFQEMVDKLQDVENATKKTAAVMRDNTQGSLDLAASAWSGFLITMGEELKPAILEASTKFQAMTADAQAWVSENPETVRTFADLAGKAAIAGLAIKAAALTFGTLTTAVTMARQATIGAQMAYVAVRGVTVAASSAMFGGLIPALIAIPGPVGMATLAMTSFLTAPVALTGGVIAATAAAAGLGVAVGLLANKWFDADKKLTGLINNVAQFFGADDIYNEKTGKGVKAGAVRVSADGTERNVKTGKVVKLGSGSAGVPRDVADARAAGNRSLADVNAYIAKQREDRKKAAAAGKTGAEGAAPGTGATQEPANGRAGSEAQVRETQAQTRSQEAAARRQEAATHETNRRLGQVVDGLKRRQLPAGPQTAGAI